MLSAATVLIHPSQFPDRIQRDLLESLRTRRVNHKFHYDSAKQTQKWLALHEAYSPSRNDPSCTATYDAAFKAAATLIAGTQIQVIGLGCGGGQKDTRLIELLRGQGKEVSYVPCDVSTAMVLVARQTALNMVPDLNCFPVVCDLSTADDLPEIFAGMESRTGAARLITFFGMIPNFEPEIILPRLAGLVREEDNLLFSANLAPGRDYASGVREVLSQYDNPLTRDWLMTFLIDLGVDRDAGKIQFTIEDDSAGLGLKRISASFQFSKTCEIRAGGEAFKFAVGDGMRMFYSYRYTPKLVRDVLEKHGLRARDQWITPSEEEGVFLCSRNS